VHHQALGGHAGGPGDVVLTAGGHVEVAALLGGQLRHGRAEERLGGVVDARAEGGDRFAAPGPQVGLVVDEQRGAELAGELERVAPADDELALVADGGGVGEQRERERGHDRLTSGRGR
jgi:hypothetical protein